MEINIGDNFTLLFDKNNRTAYKASQGKVCFFWSKKLSDLKGDKLYHGYRFKTYTTRKHKR